jgi:hypothetical protein
MGSTLQNTYCSCGVSKDGDEKTGRVLRQIDANKVVKYLKRRNVKVNEWWCSIRDDGKGADRIMEVNDTMRDEACE